MHLLRTSGNATAEGDDGATELKWYFDELEPELQTVLRAQLQTPGDVSAVIETPGEFSVFLAEARNAETLRVAALSLPKRSYEEWLAARSEQPP